MFSRVVCLVIPVFLVSVALTCDGQQMNAADSPYKNVVMTAAWVDCLNKAWKSSDAKLNKIYVHVQQNLIAEDLQRLIVAQRYWVQFRDANCAAAYGLYGGGTGGPPARLACLEKDTRERTKELLVMYPEH